MPCSFCHEEGHTITTCSRVPTCSFCGQKGHKITTCSRVPTCSFCEQKGHTKATCPDRITCGVCGKKGHNSRTCSKETKAHISRLSPQDVIKREWSSGLTQEQVREIKHLIEKWKAQNRKSNSRVEKEEPTEGIIFSLKGLTQTQVRELSNLIKVWKAENAPNAIATSIAGKQNQLKDSENGKKYLPMSGKKYGN